jgi:Histidine kinase-like ATPase domain
MPSNWPGRRKPGVAGPDRMVRLELRQRRGAVRVAVRDEGSGFAPEASCSRPDETGGWGLVLVDRIADRWAVTFTATGSSGARSSPSVVVGQVPVEPKENEHPPHLV